MQVPDLGASQVALVVKNLPASAADNNRLWFDPWVIRSLGEGHGNPLQYSCWRIPWTEEPGGLQSIRSQRVGHDLATECISRLAHDPMYRRKLAFKSKSCHSSIFFFLRWKTLSVKHKFSVPRQNCQRISFLWRLWSRKIFDIVQSVYSQLVLLTWN